MKLKKISKPTKRQVLQAKLQQLRRRIFGTSTKELHGRYHQRHYGRAVPKDEREINSTINQMYSQEMDDIERFVSVYKNK